MTIKKKQKLSDFKWSEVIWDDTDFAETYGILSKKDLRHALRKVKDTDPYLVIYSLGRGQLLFQGNTRSSLTALAAERVNCDENAFMDVYDRKLKSLTVEVQTIKIVPSKHSHY